MVAEPQPVLQTDPGFKDLDTLTAMLKPFRCGEDEMLFREHSGEVSR